MGGACECVSIPANFRWLTQWLKNRILFGEWLQSTCIRKKKNHVSHHYFSGFPSVRKMSELPFDVGDSKYVICNMCVYMLLAQQSWIVGWGRLCLCGGVAVLARPVCEPDLNSIKHLWDIVYRNIHIRTHRLPKKQTNALIIQVLEQISQETVHPLIRSMSRRCREWIQEGGGPYTRLSHIMSCLVEIHTSWISLWPHFSSLIWSIILNPSISLFSINYTR